MMRFVALLLLSLCLIGCDGHSREYLEKGGEISSLVVPEGVPVVKQQDYYAVPKVSATPSKKSVSLVPPTLQNH